MAWGCQAESGPLLREIDRVIPVGRAGAPSAPRGPLVSRCNWLFTSLAIVSPRRLIDHLFNRLGCSAKRVADACDSTATNGVLRLRVPDSAHLAPNGRGFDSRRLHQFDFMGLAVREPACTPRRERHGLRSGCVLPPARPRIEALAVVAHSRSPPCPTATLCDSLGRAAW